MTKMFSLLLVAIGAICLSFFGALVRDQPTLQSEPWQALIDKPAPEWIVEDWINSEPISVNELKGKVVLIRWWLESCPYCQASAPTLNGFHAAYEDQGLVVIGMYHEKPKGRKVTADQVNQYAHTKGFAFPIAIDQQWRTLHQYWPAEIEMNYTSVSFLLDRNGIIRYIHPGGSYSIDEQPFDNPQWKEDYFKLKSNIETLL